MITYNIEKNMLKEFAYKQFGNFAFQKLKTEENQKIIINKKAPDFSEAFLLVALPEQMSIFFVEDLERQ
ncbi:MAG: hypothetical protein ABI793_04285 [Flavobacterium sp.]